MDRLPSVSHVLRARLPKQPHNKLWDIFLSHRGTVLSVEESTKSHESLETGLTIDEAASVLDAAGRLVAPSLCHAHVHLDKCFLLQDAKYEDLEVLRGDFNEAILLTNKAKERFHEEDLIRRGRRLVEESIQTGVTTMRAFVEVDEIVQNRCLRAALSLKEFYQNKCHIQVCVFAQLALFSEEDNGLERRSLIEKALESSDVEAISSTPYVESKPEAMEENIRWTIALAIKHDKHLDFHLDYDLDPLTKPQTFYVLDQLREQQWNARMSSQHTVNLGHCTRLTLFNPQDWNSLRTLSADFPLTFVGLPSSDLFMMGRPCGKGSERVRGTLQVLEIIQNYGIPAAVSINNVGNAFTPYGNCDPLSLASLGVGLYQAPTTADTEILYECVSSRAKAAIGVSGPSFTSLKGQSADLVVIGSPSAPFMSRNVTDAVYNPDWARQTIFKGRLVGSRGYCP